MRIQVANKTGVGGVRGLVEAKDPEWRRLIQGGGTCQGSGPWVGAGRWQPTRKSLDNRQWEKAAVK